MKTLNIPGVVTTLAAVAAGTGTASAAEARRAAIEPPAVAAAPAAHPGDDAVAVLAEVEVLTPRLETTARLNVLRGRTLVQAVELVAGRPQGYLGLVLRQGPPPAAGAGPADAVGVSVQDVIAGSPAAVAGVWPDDVITALDGKAPAGPAELAAAAHALPPGRKVVLQVSRRGHSINLNVTLGALPQAGRDRLLNEGRSIRPPGTPLRVWAGYGHSTGAPVYVSGRVLGGSPQAPVADAAVAATAEAGGGDPNDGTAAVTSTLVNGAYVLRVPGPGRYQLRVSRGGVETDQPINVPPAGLQHADMVITTRPYITDLRVGQIRRLGYLGLVLRQKTANAVEERGPVPAHAGVGVHEVVAGGPGAEAGLRGEDIILAVDGKPVNDPAELSALVKALPAGKKVVLQVSRKGQKLDVPATLGQIILPATDLREDALTDDGALVNPRLLAIPLQDALRAR